jgi:hypothetical protein
VISAWRNLLRRSNATALNADRQSASPLKVQRFLAQVA